MSQSPISDYALLSHCRSAPLVSREGSVDSLCYRRFAGPAVFARLLDEDGAGEGTSRSCSGWAASTISRSGSFPISPGTGEAGAPRGDGAWTQNQLDVHGEVLSAAHRLLAEIGGLDPTTKRFLVWLADAVAERWTKKDNGIWEIRGEPKHFTYSKLMCWVAMERALALADFLEASAQAASWTATRDEIRAAILEPGWSDRAGAFAQAFGSHDLDASVLQMPIVGFLPATDPRMRSTIDAIEERLTGHRGLVYRYRAADGLAGDEGTFLLFTFWLAHAPALAGEVDRAREFAGRAAAYANDVGLLAEEVDPESGELLGNFPPAFSHIGLVNGHRRGRTGSRRSQWPRSTGVAFDRPVRSSSADHPAG